MFWLSLISCFALLCQVTGTRQSSCGPNNMCTCHVLGYDMLFQKSHQPSTSIAKLYLYYRANK